MPQSTITFDYSLGDRVKLIDIDRPAYVDGIFHGDPQGPMYRVVYWNDGKREQVAVYGYEIKSL